MYFSLKILILLVVVCATNCARILGVFPMASRSHYILASSLMRGLADRGHDVTTISPFGEKDAPSNYRDIVLLDENADLQIPDLFKLESMNEFSYRFFLNFMGNKVTEETFNNTKVQKLLKSNEQFDVVIVEHFLNPAHNVFAWRFKCPLVSFVTFGSNFWINPVVGNPSPPSYVPEQSIHFNHLRFFDRFKNTLYYIFNQLNLNLVFYPAQERILKKYFPDAPALSALNYNASIVLLNSHWSTNMAVPRVPNMIDIGGFHVKPPKKLPTDLQAYLDQATNGVIYFSMGSGLRSASLPPEKLQALLAVFAKLKEQVLWKWEEDNLPNQPKNVKIGKWLPQQDILAHPNIKLFITHGGLLSMIESVYHGVPLLAIPIFGDQKINAARVVESGIGLSVDYATLDEVTLLETVRTLLLKPSFRKNVRSRSKAMHDRQVQPLDHADYWIQYAIRHHGAPHLRVAGLDLAWYQYCGLDIAFFVASIALVVGYTCLKMCRRRKVPSYSVDKKVK